MAKESNVSQSIVLFGWVVKRLGSLDLDGGVGGGNSLVELHFSRHAPVLRCK